MSTMNRAERHRAARMKAGEGLAVAPEALETPNHWHADAVAYSHVRDGNFMDAVHLHNLVTNDLVLAETYVLRCVKPLSGPERAHVAIEQAAMCSVKEHYEEAEADLIDGDDA